MKTILIAHNYSEISFAAMSFHLANYLAKQGNKVIFISHQPYFLKEQTIDFDHGKLIVTSWSSQKRPTGINDCLWFFKIYQKHKPEIVIGHFVGSNISILLSKILSLGKVKTFEYYHTLSSQLLADIKINSIKQKLFWLRKKIFYSFLCDKIICPSNFAKIDLKNHYGFNKSNVILNPMTDRFFDNSNKNNDKIIINFLGRLDNSKGVLILIEAFKAFKIKFPSSKIQLNIAGSGNLEHEIQELIFAEATIQFLGSLPYNKVDTYLKSGNFTIIPSKFDNLPTVGIESLMNQTPLLISKNTGLTEYLSDGFDCFKFNPTVEDLILMFEKVELNFDNFIAMQQNARTTFLNEFGIEKYCVEMNNLIL